MQFVLRSWMRGAPFCHLTHRGVWQKDYFRVMVEMGTDVSIQVRNEVLERKKNGCHLQDDGREMNRYSNFIGRLFIENAQKKKVCLRMISAMVNCCSRLSLRKLLETKKDYLSQWWQVWSDLMLASHSTCRLRILKNVGKSIIHTWSPGVDQRQGW